MVDIMDDSNKRVRNDMNALRLAVSSELCAYRVRFSQGEEREANASQTERPQLE